MDIERIISDLKRDEGFVSYGYLDSVGVLTIAYGRNIDPRHGVGLTEAEGEHLLRNDIHRAMTDLDIVCPGWRAHPSQVQDALIQMVFNLGRPRFSQFTRMLDALARNDYPDAAREALDSKWAGQVGARAQRIADKFRTAK